MTGKSDAETVVLVVGQTPPPWGGQAVMIQTLLGCSFPGVRLEHVRMSFSATISDIGRIGLRKVAHLAGTILRIWRARLFDRATCLYYPPAAMKTPILRDIVILLATRWAFRSTVFHIHPVGLRSVYEELNPLMRFLFRRAYMHPTVVIDVGNTLVRDSAFLGAEHSVVVRNGIEDRAGGLIERPPREVPRIICLTSLSRIKGLFLLLEAVAILRKRGESFALDLAGEFVPPEIEREVQAFIGEAGLEGMVTIHGVVAGEEKHRVLAGADICCYLTQHPTETLPLTLVEAMQYSLPIVAPDWQGVPEMITEGENGFMVPVRDSGAAADRLSRLLADPELRSRMGAAGRERFVRDYSLAEFERGMARAFDLAIGAR